MQVSKHEPETEMEMNMTPLIDCVFLLIVFFMIITDLTQADLEMLQLPPAKAAVEDKPDPKVVRPVFNIPVSGKIIVRRETLYDPEINEDDLTQVEQFLAIKAKQMKQEFFDPIGKTGPKIPDDPLLIRADENTEFKYIQRIMEICGKKDIQIWKLELGAKDESLPEEGEEGEE